MTRLRRLLFVLVLLVVIVAAPAQAIAAGSEYSEGTAVTTGLTFFTKWRYISYPPTPGPEVVYWQSFGPAGLFLGIHNCYGGGAGPIYAQDFDAYADPVGYSSTARWFCVLSYSNSGSGSFGGTIAWD